MKWRDIKLLCHICGNKVGFATINLDTSEITVRPCQLCLRRERDTGRHEGPEVKPAYRLAD